MDTLASCFLTILLLEESVRSAALCTFPSDLRGDWISSKKGNVTFTPTRMLGYHPCLNPAACPPSVPDSWECWDRVDDRYVIRTVPFTDSGSTGRLYTCLYLRRLSDHKYLSYQAPSALRGSPYFDYVISVGIKSVDLFTPDLCDLKTNPSPVARYNLFVQSGAIDTARSACPTELLGNYQLTSQCGAVVDVCSDRKTVVVTNSTCSSPVFYSDAGQLSCLHSLASDSATYVTLYNHDASLNESSTYRFVCLALTQTNNQTLVHQSPRDCSRLTLTGQTSNRFTLDTIYLCPFSCNFSVGLVGTWLSSRKGQLLISNDHLSGFEPWGDSCTTCTSLPTTFECYIRAGSRYLLRSIRTDVGGNSVRIYVCLEFMRESAHKYTYYQAHSTKDRDLHDYVTLVNAAAPVDSMEMICDVGATYDPALYSVLLKSGSLTSAGRKCPSDLDFVYNTTLGACQYSLSACDDESEMALSRGRCSWGDIPDTDSGRFHCIFSISSEDGTYLTVLNKELPDGEDMSARRFSCFVLQRDGPALHLTRAPGGCHAGQNATHVEAGSSYTFHLVGSCPDEEFIWIAAVIVVAVVAATSAAVATFVGLWGRTRRRCRQASRQKDEESILADEEFIWIAAVIVVAVLAATSAAVATFVGLWRRTRRRRRQASRQKDEESILGSDDTSEGGAEGSAGRLKKHGGRGEGRGRAGLGVAAEEGRVGLPSEETLEYEQESQLRRRRRQEEEEEDDDRKQEDTDKGSVKALTDKHAPETFPGNGRHKAALGLASTSDHDFHSSLSRSSCSLKEGGQDTDLQIKKQVLCDDDASSDTYSPDFSSSMSIDSATPSTDSGHRQKLRQLDATTDKLEPHLSEPEQNERALRSWTVRKINPSLVKDPARLRKRSECERRDFRRSTKVSLRRFVSLRKESVKAGCRRDKATSKQGKRSCRQTRPSQLAPAEMKEGLQPCRRGAANLVETPFHEQYYSYRKARTQMVEDGFWGAAGGGMQAVDDEIGFEQLQRQLAGSYIPGQVNGGGQPLTGMPLPLRNSTQPHYVSSALPQITIARASQIESHPGISSSSRGRAVATSDMTGVKQLGLVAVVKEEQWRHRAACTRADQGDKTGTSADHSDEAGASAEHSDKTGTSAEHSDKTRPKRIKARKKQQGVDSSVEAGAQTEKSSRGVSSEVRRLLSERLLSLESSCAEETARRTTGLSVGGSGSITANRKPPLSVRSRSNTFCTRARMRALRCGHYQDDRTKETKVPAHLETAAPWPRDRPDLTWSYNLPAATPQWSRKCPTTVVTTTDRTSPSVIPTGRTSPRCKEYLNFRQLLEELYWDKRYMDKVINTSAQDKTEVDVLYKLRTGRNYLLQRAHYWLERGPLPPRPPTTELGLRLQRSHTAVQMDGQQLSPLPAIRNTSDSAHKQ